MLGITLGTSIHAVLTAMQITLRFSMLPWGGEYLQTLLDLHIDTHGFQTLLAS
jgi:hypothetical protein